MVIRSSEAKAGTSPQPPLPPTWPKQAPPGFHVLAKPRGAVCNLDCTYCFFLSKESLYPDSDSRMDDTVLEAYVRQVIEAQRVPSVTIAWQGGEPTLMGLDFFRRAFRLVQRYARPGMQVEHTLQTNGTLLDDEWAAFLRENKVLVGLSIDGPRALHDAYRVDKGGKPTFDKVMAAAKLLQRSGVEFNVLCSVHAANAGAPLEVYRFFRDELGARFFQFIPIIERATPQLLPIANLGWGKRHGERPLYVQEGSLTSERSVKPEAWGTFLCAIFDEWVRRDVGQVFVQLFDATLAAFLGMESPLCIFAKRCGNAVALEHNGDLYSCDHYVEPDYLLGNIREQHMLELVASDKQRAFGRHKEESLPRYCRDCEVLFACNGECPRNRFAVTPDGEQGLNYLCAGYKSFFQHIDGPMRKMAELVRHGKYADEVMAWVKAGP